MRRKELLEKFNDNQAKTRSLVSQYKENPTDELKQQIRGMQDILTQQKAELSDLQAEGTKGSVDTKKEGKRNMEKMAQLERRAMADMLRYDARSIHENGKDFTEYREQLKASVSEGNGANNSNGNGGLTVPTTIENTIIEKLTEDSNVFARVGKLSVGKGYAEILRETNVGQAGFVGEMQSLPETVNKFTKIHMKASRVGAYMQLTQQLINDSAFDITTYCTNYLTKAMAKAIERSILVGEKAEEGFESIESQSDEKHTIILDPAHLTYENLIDFYVKLHPSFLENAMFIVSREMFDAIAKLADRKDGSGDYLLGKNMVAGKPGYNLFGVLPVVVSDALDASNTDIIFGDFEGGYKVMVQKGMSVAHVTSDSAQALQGGHLIVMDAYMDGAVVNPEAFITSQRKSNAGATPQDQLNKANTSAKSGVADPKDADIQKDNKPAGK